mmetsp:Transcript_110462/g.352157  ORF Transcript_110462/g.352157 Transcript_110462/m.352157 type:complete len:109 (+) Transcript_110462:124-450(+)
MELDTTTHNGAVRACGKGGQWALALGLLSDIELARMELNTHATQPSRLESMGRVDRIPFFPFVFEHVCAVSRTCRYAFGVFDTCMQNRRLLRVVMQLASQRADQMANL